MYRARVNYLLGNNMKFRVEDHHHSSVIIIIFVHCTHYLFPRWPSLQLILEISTTSTSSLVSYLLADNWLINRLCAQCMISESNVKLFFVRRYCVFVFSSKWRVIKQLLDSIFVISGIISVRVISRSRNCFTFTITPYRSWLQAEK